MYKVVYKYVAGIPQAVKTHTREYTNYLLQHGWYLNKEDAERNK